MNRLYAKNESLEENLCPLKVKIKYSLTQIYMQRKIDWQ